MNTVLNDEMMMQAVGGADTLPGPKYEIGDTVYLKFLNEGVTTPIKGFEDDRRFNIADWEYLIVYEVNGTTYEHWYPELAL